MFFTKLFTLVLIVTILACTSFPLAIFLTTGKKELIFPTHIPFVPTDKLWGYAIYCVYFIIALTTAYAGTVANEVLLITSTIHIWAMYKIMDQAVIGLNRATGSLHSESVKNSTWLHFRIRNIVLMHRNIYL